LVPNPEFKDDNTLYAFSDNKFVGFEVWQVKAGTIFDNILVTDDQEEANKWAEKTKVTQAGEKVMSEKEEEERRAKESEEDNADSGDNDASKDEL